MSIKYLFIFFYVLFLCLPSEAQVTTNIDVALGEFRNYLNDYGPEEKNIFTFILYSYKSIVKGLDPNLQIPGFCLICPFFQSFYITASFISTNIALLFQEWVLKILAVGSLFFILFKTFQLFLKYGDLKPAKFIGEMFNGLGKIIIATVLIIFLKDFFNLLINPLLNLIYSLALKLHSQNLIYLDGNTYFILNTVGKDCNIASCNINDSNLFLNTTLCTNIIKIICWMHGTLITGLTIGMTLIYYAFSHSSNVDATTLITGVTLFCSYGIILLTFSFRFFEAILKLSVVFALMPFFLIAWPFKFTKETFTIKAFMIFLNGSIVISVLTIVIFWVVELLSYAFGGLEKQKELIGYLIEGKIQEALNMLNSDGLVFLNTCAIAYLATKLTSAIPDLVLYLTDTSHAPAFNIGANGKQSPVNAMLRTPEVMKGAQNLFNQKK